MLNITLYTKNPCPLCEDVKTVLATLHDTYPYQLTEVDITQDRELHALYRFEIPVLEIGQKRIKAPISLLDLNRFLREAA